MAKKKKKSLLQRATDAVDHAIHPDHVESEGDDMEDTDEGDEAEVLDQEQVSNVLDQAEVAPSSDVKPGPSISKEKKPKASKVRGKDMKFKNQNLKGNKND